MNTRIIQYSDFVEALRNIPRKQGTLLMAVDGCGGSGKSTFARMLQKHAANVTVIEMDDFFRPSAERPQGDAASKPIGGDFDWRRMAEQVLEPLRINQPGCYQRYDWVSDALAEFHTVPVGGIVIIEGIYSTMPDIERSYDYRVWVHAPYDTRLARGIARDGEAARHQWVNDWMPTEQRYVATFRPYGRADLIVDGSGTVPHDPALAFVRTTERTPSDLS